MEMEVGAWMARVDLPNRSNSPRRASWPAPVAPCDFFQRPIFPGDLGARTWSAHPVDGSGIIPARPIPRTGIHTPDVAGHSAYREERGSGAVRPHIWDRIPVFPRAFRCQGACFHQCDPLNIPRTRYTPRLKLQSEHSFQPKTALFGIQCGNVSSQRNRPRWHHVPGTKVLPSTLEAEGAAARTKSLLVHC